MTLPTIHIIGCGTVGSNLLLQLCKQLKFGIINIYDDDLVSDNKDINYPFVPQSIGLSKVDTLKFLLENFGLTENVIVNTFNEKVTRDIIEPNSLIIDCRDNKFMPITSDMKISMDGPTLILDCRKNNVSIKDYNEYVYEINYSFIDLGISISTRFILEEKYKLNNAYFYDLNDIVNLGKEIEM